MNHTKGFICIFTLLLCFSWVLPAMSIERPNEVRTDRAKIKKDGIRQPAGTFQLPGHSITVRINGENSLGGRKVTAKIRKGSSRKSKTVALNATGDAVVVFQLGSVQTLVHGSYNVTVAKGPSAPDHYASSANYCFDGTDPAMRNVSVNASNRNVSADFNIRYSVAWNMHGMCW